MAAYTGERLGEQLARIRYIDEKIREEKYWNAERYAKKLGVSTRTIKRDVKRLEKHFRAPIEYSQAKNGYWYREKDFSLRILSISQSELFALYLSRKILAQYQNTPLYGNLEQAFRNIDSALPDTVTIPAQDGNADAFTFLSEPVPMKKIDHWDLVFGAINQKKRLTFRYRVPNKPKPMEREVHPYHVVCWQGEWYLIGYCTMKNKRRIFALSRMENVSISTTSADVKKFDIRKYMGNHFGIFRDSSVDDPYLVELRFGREVAEYVLERCWHPTEEKERQEDGSVILTFQVDHLFEVKRWVLSWGPGVEVLGPEKLRDEIRKDLADAASRYVPVPAGTSSGGTAGVAGGPAGNGAGSARKNGKGKGSTAGQDSGRDPAVIPGIREKREMRQQSTPAAASLRTTAADPERGPHPAPPDRPIS